MGTESRGRRQEEGLIRVRRSGGGGRDRFRSYTVLVDDQKVGKLRRGEEGEFSVAPGKHRLRLKIDWKDSAEWGVTLAAGEVGDFVCGPAGGAGGAVIGQLAAGEDHYIDLHPADA